ncbi:hypothetical protein TRFO_34397 [Tritrichomonas foetus]|uniref:Uncharacterized protein n=1 Tax=Tritrichomonas foetus TaxID=1144522 RepID=A0A1J4JJ48_9EUKA|nr:hypothetical protein TRFO_34397 [Tritrichomonas foetus]|eukprot:OHS99190.1 hypothetical protein TRFO_34397 [Tritrichomonas foetus]
MLSLIMFCFLISLALSHQFSDSKSIAQANYIPIPASQIGKNLIKNSIPNQKSYSSSGYMIDSSHSSNSVKIFHDKDFKEITNSGSYSGYKIDSSHATSNSAKIFHVKDIKEITNSGSYSGYKIDSSHATSNSAKVFQHQTQNSVPKTFNPIQHKFKVAMKYREMMNYKDNSHQEQQIKHIPHKFYDPVEHKDKFAPMLVNLLNEQTLFQHQKSNDALPVSKDVVEWVVDPIKFKVMVATEFRKKMAKEMNGNGKQIPSVSNRYHRVP